MAHDVFISYSHIDKAIADAVCNTLENDNIRCWYAPRDIDPGQKWAASIVSAIKSSKIMVLVFTEDSNISEQVIREVSNAVSAGLTIIPMKLTDQKLSEAMQYYLATVHWLDAMDCELETAIQNVRIKVQAALNSENFLEPTPFQADTPGKKKKFFIPIAIAVLVIVGAVIGFSQLSKKPATTVIEPVQKTDPDIALATATDMILSIENPDNSYTLGNTQSNMINDGIVTSDDNFFYYRSNDNFSLYRIRKNGQDKELLLNEPVSYLAAYSGFIYYYAQTDSNYIGKYEISSGKTEILFNGMIENMRLYNDRIYFNNCDDHLYLYSISLNGTDLKCVNDKKNLHDYLLGDDCIYYIDHEDGDKLYWMSMDGSEYQKLTDCKCQHATICEGYIIYNNKSADTFNVLNLKNFNDYTICNGFYTFPSISSYGIIGVSQWGSHHVTKISLNKLSPETLIDTDAEQCCQLEGFIFYRSKSDGKYHARSISGGKILEL